MILQSPSPQDTFSGRDVLQSLPEPDMTDKLDSRLSQMAKINKVCSIYMEQMEMKIFHHVNGSWEEFVEIVKGSDGKVRVVKVKTPQGIFKRGISKSSSAIKQLLSQMLVKSK
ncbi:hypothetical protein TNCV_2114931 [Trichonephila clavipes]|nr:hypothetical protein TNCV_2114931 [Trichonephila clavipes]